MSRLVLLCGVIALGVASLAVSAEPPAQLTEELKEVARVASVMVDGDVAKRIQTERSAEYFIKEHPTDRWFASDNYDVDHEAFIRTKKTLIRLSRLTSYPCDVNLWLPVEAETPTIHIVIRNVHEMSQFWTWGDLHQETPEEMQRVLETGEQVTVSKDGAMVSVLAPVYDSLGDIVGLVEVVGRQEENEQENVK